MVLKLDPGNLEAQNEVMKCKEVRHYLVLDLLLYLCIPAYLCI